MRALFDFLVTIKELFGCIINWPVFLVWRIHYEAFPKTRGKIYIRNYGSIQMGRGVYINSNLESSQLGFYPKTILHTSRQGSIQLGNNVGLSNAALYARQLIKLEDDVRIGAGVKIYDNDFHELGHGPVLNREEVIPSVPVVIGEGAFVGAGSIILKGVNIGKNSIIGAGSVVTKNIPEGEVWAGNPAKFIKKVSC